VVFADQDCRGAARGKRCSVDLKVLRLTDRRVFLRGRFTRTGAVAAITVSPRGAIAVTFAAHCPRGRACAPARLYLIDARGTRLAASGASLDPGSLAERGTTVYWREAGHPHSARLSG
jgi:hypothetical protein